MHGGLRHRLAHPLPLPLARGTGRGLGGQRISFPLDKLTANGVLQRSRNREGGSSVAVARLSTHLT
jgi:hypothetical protein